jgi:hypothetical protein
VETEAAHHLIVLLLTEEQVLEHGVAVPWLVLVMAMLLVLVQVVLVIMLQVVLVVLMVTTVVLLQAMERPMEM